MVEFSEYGEITEYDVSFLKETLRRGVTLDFAVVLEDIPTPLSHFTYIVSFDLSRYFLNTLTVKGREKRPNSGDMRRLPFKPESFDNIINLYISFGYFNDEESELVLREVSRVLKADGIFFLETANAGWIIRNFGDGCLDETDNFYVLYFINCSSISRSFNRKCFLKSCQYKSSV